MSDNSHEEAMANAQMEYDRVVALNKDLVSALTSAISVLSLDADKPSPSKAYRARQLDFLKDTLAKATGSAA